MKVLVLPDTPNLYYTTQDAHGRLARPDYAAIRNEAQKLGDDVAYAFVNPGADRTFADSLGQKALQLSNPRLRM